MQNSDLWTGITSLYESQTKSVVLCMQNSVICSRKTSLYGFQPSSMFFFHAKQRVYDQTYKFVWGPDLICGFCMQPATFGPKLHVSMGPRTHLWFSACKTPCLASELLVSMGPSPHLWFLHSKQRLLEQNSKALCVPDMTCRFVHERQRD